MAEIGYKGPPPIDSYGGGGFRISGSFHEGDLMIAGQQPIAWTPGALDEAAFAPVFACASDLDVLLVGMGTDIALLPAVTRAALEGAGVGVEIMSTASACRTYNVLLAENRRVAVALFAV